jgi:hypothetical protein
MTWELLCQWQESTSKDVCCAVEASLVEMFFHTSVRFASAPASRMFLGRRQSTSTLHNGGVKQPATHDVGRCKRQPVTKCFGGPDTAAWCMALLRKHDAGVEEQTCGLCKTVRQPISQQLYVASSTAQLKTVNRSGYMMLLPWQSCLHHIWEYPMAIQVKQNSLNCSGGPSAWRLQPCNITSTPEDVTKNLATCESWSWWRAHALDTEIGRGTVTFWTLCLWTKSNSIES